MSHSSSSNDASTSEDHKNEGFLKSIWHNLTNHPAHQKQEGQADSSTKAEDSEKKPDGEKKD